jgi:hypothetical protein
MVHAPALTAAVALDPEGFQIQGDGDDVRLTMRAGAVDLRRVTVAACHCPSRPEPLLLGDVPAGTSRAVVVAPLLRHLAATYARQITVGWESDGVAHEQIVPLPNPTRRPPEAVEPYRIDRTVIPRQADGTASWQVQMAEPGSSVVMLPESPGIRVAPLGDRAWRIDAPAGAVTPSPSGITRVRFGVLLASATAPVMAQVYIIEPPSGPAERVGPSQP